MTQDTTDGEHKPDEAGLPPWDEITELHVMGATGRNGSLRSLMGAWLRELPRVVLGTYGRKAAGVISYPPDRERADNLRTIRTEHGQVLTLRFNAFRDHPRPGDGGERPSDPRWFGRVEVGGFAQRTDNAALAALSVLEGSRVGEGGVDRIRARLRSRGDEHAHPGTGNWSEPDDLTLEEERLLAFGWALVRHHRPDLDLASADGVAVLVGVCKRAAEVADATELLSNYLEFGVDGRDTRPDVEDAQMDVYAAELHHIVGMSQREIARKLRLPVSDRDKCKGGHPRAGERIKRGTALFVQALGEDGWQRYRRRMRDEYEHSGNAHGTPIQ